MAQDDIIVEEHNVDGTGFYPLQVLSFTHVNRQAPPKQPPHVSATNFLQISAVMEEAQARLQASRCSQCGIPFCSHGCPLGNNIPDWLEATAAGNIDEAIELVFDTNPFPTWTGTTCPQADLCESSYACTLTQSGHGGVVIGGIENFLGETAWNTGKTPSWTPEIRLQSKVAIIGSGPAGMAAAVGLNKLGHEVHVFDRALQGGGLLRTGIPPQKISKNRVDRVFDKAEKAGIIFHFSTAIGNPAQSGAFSKIQPANVIPFSSLVDDFNAIVIATGIYEPKRVQVAGNAADKITPWIEHLFSSQWHLDRAGVSGNDDFVASIRGKDFLCIGGGDTIVDNAKTLIRQGAKSVTIMYHGSEERMRKNITLKDLEGALAEGVHLITDASIFEVNHGSNGRMVAQYRQDGEVKTFECHGIIDGIGTDPENIQAMFDAPALPVNDNGTLFVTPLEPQPIKSPIVGGYVGRAVTPTSDAHVFAGGDIVIGKGGLIVYGIKAGRDMVAPLHQSINDDQSFMEKWQVEQQKFSIS